MTATKHSFLVLTAADLMTCDILCIHQDTFMRDAARLLREARVSGAPVVSFVCVLAQEPEPGCSSDSRS